MFIAVSPADMADLETTLSMSGLAFMQAMQAGTLACPPIWGTMGIGLDHVETGKTVFHGTPTFDHLNPASGVHGGWYGTILDSCMSCAVMTVTPKGSVYTTLEYKVNLTGAIPLGGKVLATGTIDHAGRTTGVAHGEVRDAETGKLYATGSATCLIMQRG